MQEIADAMTHLEQDRNATPTELRKAGRLRNKLVSLIAGEYRRNGLSYCQAKRLAVGDYHAARIKFLNHKPWKTLRHELSHKAHTYVSTQRLAAEMKLGERDIFEKSYNGKGICSADTVELDHAANLWQSSLSVKDANGEEKVLFQGIRHGVLSPYGLPAGSEQRTSGALNRAKEVVATALYSQNDLMTRALEGEVVPLRLVSTSLLTPTSVAGKEKAMLRDQMAAWKTLCDPLKQPLEICVHDHEGNIKTVQVALSVAALNFGVNEAALTRIRYLDLLLL
ncbi:Inositol phosphate phosphatase SopB [Sodalis glossinidius str. 'morsitans']|nr:inositol phosphate phosphatase SopB [Sodalis glossinidius]CRL44271.1 Inositol phosphate phosphatase SopB [Sodalis glossinidius str. 'morsitans']